MILVDFSAVMHQMIFASINIAKPKKDKETHKYITDDFIKVAEYRILEELFNIQTRFSSKYKDIVLCLDNHTAKNWRKNILGTYKSKRKQEHQDSEINFSEVYEKIDNLVDQIDKYAPWKVIDVASAEGDDCILTLAKNYAKIEPILIISFDKDMIQAQKYGNVKQFNQITGKFITVAEKNHGDIKSWLIEHVCLGDEADEVPKIVDNIKFSQNFKSYLESKKIEVDEYSFAKMSNSEKENIIGDFNIYQKDRKGNDTVLDIYAKLRFGPSSLKKVISDYNGLENWLHSNPLLEYNFNINKRLVLGEYIPDDLEKNIIATYKSSSNKYTEEFRTFLENEQLGNILTILPSNFSDGKEISVNDLLW